MDFISLLMIFEKMPLRRKNFQSHTCFFKKVQGCHVDISRICRLSSPRDGLNSLTGGDFVKMSWKNFLNQCFVYFLNLFALLHVVIQSDKCCDHTQKKLFCHLTLTSFLHAIFCAERVKKGLFHIQYLSGEEQKKPIHKC